MLVALSHVQVLIIPHLAARNDRSLKSYQEFEDDPILDSKEIDW